MSCGRGASPERASHASGNVIVCARAENNRSAVSDLGHLSASGCRQCMCSYACENVSPSLWICATLWFARPLCCCCSASPQTRPRKMVDAVSDTPPRTFLRGASHERTDANSVCLENCFANLASFRERLPVRFGQRLRRERYPVRFGVRLRRERYPVRFRLCMRVPPHDAGHHSDHVLQPASSAYVSRFPTHLTRRGNLWGGVSLSLFHRDGCPGRTRVRASLFR